MPVTPLELVATVINIFDCFMGEYRDMLIVEEVESPEKEQVAERAINIPKDFDEQLRSFVIFACTWGFGASTDENTRPKFN